MTLPVNNHESNDGAGRETGAPGGRGWHSRGYLPHYDNPQKIQHVTVHLADSLPKSAIEKIDELLEAVPEGERLVERRRRLHAYVDAGHGACILKEPELAEMIERAFLHFDGERYRLHAWVVMPNHFHVLFQPLAPYSMSEIVASWKRFTATEIKKWLRARQESGDPESALLDGPMWHREYWDRYIRNAKHFDDAVAYIHINPVKAGLCADQKSWKWSSAREYVA